MNTEGRVTCYTYIYNKERRQSSLDYMVMFDYIKRIRNEDRCGQ